MIKHGDCVKAKNKRTRLNIIWTGIKQRCYNKNSTSYKYYGMKGITVYIEYRSTQNL